MSLADLVRNGIALANSQTATLQVSVRHEAWIGQDATGKPLYATAVTRSAIVTDSSRRFKRNDGEEIVATTYVAFLSPIPVRTPTVTGRQGPIDERDRLTMPDGRTAPIVRVDGGLVDPSTGRTYLHQVWLGSWWG